MHLRTRIRIQMGTPETVGEVCSWDALSFLGLQVMVLRCKDNGFFAL
jgi:hypothetical protein